MAIQFTGGNFVGGVAGSNMFLARESPEFHTAYYILVAFFIGGIVAAFIVIWLLRISNNQKFAIVQGTPDEDRQRLDEETRPLGDKSPFFMYTF